MIDLQSLREKVGADSLSALPRDVSPREYFLGERAGKEFILMLYPDASKDHIDEMMGFINIGNALSNAGLKTPELFEKNERECYSLFEYLGGNSFGYYLRANPDKAEHIYELATDVLFTLKEKKTLSDGLPFYNQSRIHENRRQGVDYYMAMQRKSKINESTVISYLNVWDEIESSLPPCPQGFVHGDYHLENMIYVTHETGLKRCGLIDFQDALSGPLPYDLVNLLEDARVDVPASIKNKMIDRYCSGMSEHEKAAFLDWYRVLGTQFHCRVIGLFIKLSAEQGRDAYLIHIERLQRYIVKALETPVLAPLKLWFEKEGLDFDSIKDLDGDIIRKTFETISFDTK